MATLAKAWQVLNDNNTLGWRGLSNLTLGLAATWHHMPIMRTVWACPSCAINEKIQQRHMRAVLSGLEANVSDKDLALASGQSKNCILKGAKCSHATPYIALHSTEDHAQCGNRCASKAALNKPYYGVWIIWRMAYGLLRIWDVINLSPFRLSIINI